MTTVAVPVAAPDDSPTAVVASLSRLDWFGGFTPISRAGMAT